MLGKTTRIIGFTPDFRDFLKFKGTYSGQCHLILPFCHLGSPLYIPTSIVEITRFPRWSLMEITRFLASSTFSCNILKTAKLPEHLQKSNSLWPNSHSNIFLTFISTNQVKEHVKHPMKSAKHLTFDPLNPPFSPPWPQPMAQRTRREALAPHRGWRGSAVRKTQLEGIGKFGHTMT